MRLSNYDGHLVPQTTVTGDFSEAGLGAL
jgi:hypothetical protein